MASVDDFDLSPERLDAIKRVMDKQYSVAQRTMNNRTMRVYFHALKVLHEDANPYYAMALMHMRDIPITIDEFIESEDFLGHDTDFKVWSSLREDLRCMNPDIWTGNDHVFQTFDGGATGCHAKDTLILMYDGSVKKVQDVAVGDLLMGPDSEPREVLSLARGAQTMYEVTPNFGGEPFIVNEDHILSLQRTAKTNLKADTLKGSIANVSIKDWLAWSKCRKHLHKLRRKEVCFTEVPELPIPPYILGLWLGDGTSIYPQITSMDSEIVKEWTRYGSDVGMRVNIRKANCGQAKLYSLRYRQGVKHPFLQSLKSLEVFNNKNIPQIYRTSSTQDRLQLLAGLLDTDGSLSCGGYEITQKNKKLTEGIAFVARSLGFRVSIKVKTLNGVDYYRVFISGDVHRIPVRVERKKHKGGKLNRDWTLSGFTVKKLDVDNYYGFSLSGDHLYLTGDFTVHHNTGKTFKAHLTQAYQLYSLCCFDRPVKLWPLLSSNTPLVIVFQSVQERVTKRVIYEPFRDMFLSLPYTKKYLTWDKEKENVLHFSNNVQVVPALAAVNNIVGQGIVSAILDEMNFMSVVEESKQVVGARGQGGKFDQAQTIYNNLTRRRKSRFPTKGPSPGIISVLSSVRYLGDFMDRRLEEIEDKKGTPDEERDVVVIRRAQYEAHPPEGYSGQKFKLLVGASNYSTRILKDHEVAGRDYPESARVEEVPVEYRTDFLNDPEGALRDVCGIATDVISPYITQRHKIIAAIMRGTERNLKCWLDKADIELADYAPDETPMPQIIEENLPSLDDRQKPRFIHVDLSLTGDRCGIAIVKVAGHDQKVNKEGLVEMLPHYVLEQGITIKPSTVHELDISEVRRWIVALKEYYGFNVHTVSYDGFQSSESMQMLRRAGILSIKVSVDTTMEPYDLFKAALYQDRFDCQDHEMLKTELAGLENNSRKKKVDHPPKGSKDLADAVAGAVFSASQSRVIRADTTTTNQAGETSERDASGRLRTTRRSPSGHRPIRR